MAQVVKLKRSSVAGNVPTTGQMAAGELAMNTADGKLFLRDDSTVRPILTTDAEITGSLNLTGDVSASAVSASTFYGDGSNLTGISSDPFPYTGSANITGSLTINGDFSVISPLKSRNSLSVTDSEIKFLLGDNSNDNQAVKITRDGSTSTDVVALNIGSDIKIKRNGGGTPEFTVGNAGFIYTQDYNGNSVSNSNPFNNGAGMGVRNTTQGSPVILGLYINGVFGAVNSAGSTLNICNPYGFSNSTGTNLYTAEQTVNFRNTSTLEISYGPASGSNDVDIIRYQSNNTDSVTDYRHGLQLSSIPNAGASTSNGRGYATNGSNVIDMDTVGYDVRGFVKVGQSIYIHEGWTTSISNTSNPTRFTITDVDYVNETITLDSNWTGATGNVSCWVEDTLAVIRNYDGNERFRFYGDGTLKLQSNISASGHVSASTYYGDGSNLTGISSDPFPYTGDADITGYLSVDGNITASGNISGSLTGSFKHLKATTIEGNSPLTIKGVSNLIFADPGDGITFSNTNLYGNPVFHGDINIYNQSQFLDQSDNIIFESTNNGDPLNGEIQFGGFAIPTKIRGVGITLGSDTVISGSTEITGSLTVRGGELIGTINGGTF